MIFQNGDDRLVVEMSNESIIFPNFTKKYFSVQPLIFRLESAGHGSSHCHYNKMILHYNVGVTWLFLR